MGNIAGTASDEQPGLPHAEKLFYLRNPSQAENSCYVGEAGGLIPPGLMAAVFGRSRLLKETFLPGIVHMPHCVPSLCLHPAWCLLPQREAAVRFWPASACHFPVRAAKHAIEM